MKRTFAAGAAMALLPLAAQAHSFGKLYNLPVPIWMYLYGAAAALLVSFLIVGYFVSAKTAQANFATVALDRWRFFRWADAPAVLATVRTIGVAGLVLTIATGLFGKNNSYQNFSMTFFWIIVMLGFTYFVALIGDLYAAVNPFRTIAEAIERLRPGLFAGQREYPARWAYYPALAFYMAFIWIELFGRTRPFSLALILLAYTAITLLAAWRWGKEAWFRHGEFFGVFFRLIALIAPFEYSAGADGRRRLRLRQPFMGLLREPAGHRSLLLFVLFMLSSTAFDGFKDTVAWVRIFWKHVYQGLMPLVGDDIVQTYPMLQKVYVVWQTVALIGSAWFYLGIYLGFLWLAKQITRVSLTVDALGLRFAFSLVPIAVVYNITHYYTLIASQGTQIVRLVSDPFGFGWDLFGTRSWLMTPAMPDAGTVWHTQVWLILFGHIVSVYLAHLEALRVFPDHRQATLSQLPMLLLMVVFTSIGLWILAQPISAGQVAG